AGDGKDVVIGDSGHAEWLPSGMRSVAYTTSAHVGGGGTAATGSSSDDTITLGNGNDVVLGGAGGGPITTGIGENVILGDNGKASYIGGILVNAVTTDPSLGGDDVIRTNDGNNIVIGGLGADRITVGNGRNIILGDSGNADFSNTGTPLQVYSLFAHVVGRGTAATGSSSNDVIQGGNGDNVVIGGSGDDQVTFGNGDNYVLGDNGAVQFALVGGVPIVTRAMSTAHIYGGDDTITLGTGTDSVIGGIGNDHIQIGDGANVVIGDSGQIVQAFDAAGNPLRHSDGKLHRDIVLETVGSVTSSIALDSAGHAAQSDLSKISSADLILLAGAYGQDGAHVNAPDSGAWQTSALLLSLTRDGNDTIIVGN